MFGLERIYINMKYNAKTDIFLFFVLFKIIVDNGINVNLNKSLEDYYANNKTYLLLRYKSA